MHVWAGVEGRWASPPSSWPLGLVRSTSDIQMSHSIFLAASLVWPRVGDRALSASSAAGSQASPAKQGGTITWSLEPRCGPIWKAVDCGRKSLIPLVLGRMGGCSVGVLGLVRFGTAALYSPVPNHLPVPDSSVRGRRAAASGCRLNRHGG